MRDQSMQEFDSILIDIWTVGSINPSNFVNVCASKLTLTQLHPEISNKKEKEKKLK